MNCAMYRINLHSGGDIKARLLEPQAKPSGPRKKIDCDWSQRDPPSDKDYLLLLALLLDPFNCPSKKADSLRASLSGFRTSHCQTVRTCHPAERSLFTLLRSLSRVRFSLGTQNSGLVFGGFPMMQP